MANLRARARSYVYALYAPSAWTHDYIILLEVRAALLVHLGGSYENSEGLSQLFMIFSTLEKFLPYCIKKFLYTYRCLVLAGVK